MARRRVRAALLQRASARAVVYCAAGGRSARAAAMLRAAGFAHVHDMGVMHAW